MGGGTSVDLSRAGTRAVQRPDVRRRNRGGPRPEAERIARGPKVVHDFRYVRADLQWIAITSAASLSAAEHHGKLGLFAGIDGVRFRRQVRPGDQLRLEVSLDRLRHGIGKAAARASVEGQTAAEGTLTFAIVDDPSAR
jgi:acyl-coenzyme A thioesterase PaaI-like protein